VSVTERNAKLDLFTLLRTWASRDDAIYPYAIQYGDSGSQQQDTQQGQVEMVASQDSAVAAALNRLGINIHAGIEIVGVTPGMPADGKLQVRDILRSVAGHRIGPKTDVGKVLQAVPAGTPVPIVVERSGHRVHVSITPTTKDGHQIVGVTLQVGYTFPFKVSVAIPDNIGGPSAGLMFALGIVDKLTPGSLTGGKFIAGTGTIDDAGKVGAIGGITQKMIGARHNGATVFLSPAENCAEARSTVPDGMRLVKVRALSDAIASLDALRAGRIADLPRC
jgi:PDZ domain-containing protein